MTSTKRKCIRIIFVVATIIILIAMVVCILIKTISEDTLSKKEKLEDFEYLYNTLVENQPMLEDYKEILGFDFVGNREYYERLIRKTRNNYEFYVMMDMIMGDFSSIHTGLFLSPFEEVLDKGYDYSKAYNRKMQVQDTTEYWIEYMLEYAKEDKCGTGFSYYDGYYVSTMCNLAENAEQTIVLLEIDGEPIDEYIKRKEVNGPIAYDAFNEKVYRECISLNLSHGKVVTATLQNMMGDIFKAEVCIRTKDSAFEANDLDVITTPKVQKLVLDEIDISAVLLDEEQEGHFEVYSDERRKTSYICLYNFKNEAGDKLAKAIQKACENDNIILDLRINEGGYRNYFIENVYPWLYKEDIESTMTYYMYKNTFYDSGIVNEGMLQDVKSITNEFQDDSKEILQFRKHFGCEGKASENKKVYVLISNLGASAADWVASLLKEQTSAILIGTQTGGEGLGNTSCVDIMLNSGLAFRYQHSQAFNPDGTDNSIYGTTADIYIPHTVESIAKRNQLMCEEGNHMSYENRLRWDNVLLETMKIIEESERTN